MSLSPNALCSLADLKESLGITDTSKDSLLTRLINSSTAAIENYCGRHFTVTTYTNEEYDGTGTNRLNLINYPVTALVLVERNLSVPGDPDWDELQSEFVKLVDNGTSGPGQVYYLGGFFERTRNFRVTYTAGFSPIPDDITDACIQLASYRYSTRVNSGLKSERLGEYSYERFDFSRGAVSRTLFQQIGIDSYLDPYRTINV